MWLCICKLRYCPHRPFCKSLLKMSEWVGVQAVWAKNGVVANLRGNRWMHNTKVQKKKKKKWIYKITKYKNQLCCFKCFVLKQCLHDFNDFNNIVQRWTEVVASQASAGCKMHQWGKKKNVLLENWEIDTFALFSEARPKFGKSSSALSTWPHFRQGPLSNFLMFHTFSVFFFIGFIQILQW